ncbi:hypothetical protein T11_2327 [Trichinella zimbabwensis]|uniref:Uncharacterized protein n=1 Tax=Trichinella zimbabwensis TaxID=268475 RepID=A0A0V1H2T2_9BILA|nr:hypothetical protein T11_2327 [Trichinella zimbabwensis]
MDSTWEMLDVRKVLVTGSVEQKYRWATFLCINIGKVPNLEAIYSRSSVQFPMKLCIILQDIYRKCFVREINANNLNRSEKIGEML